MPDRFGFLLVPKFPMATLSLAIDALALANYVSGKTLYEWRMISVHGAQVDAQNGLPVIVDHDLETAPPFDTITMCGGIDGSQVVSRTIQNWLRSRYARGATVGSLSTGSWVLARSGLLQGKRCTVHWEDLDAFRETFPDLNATSEIFEIDGRIFTCSGGSTSADLFLSFIAAKHGMELAVSVAEQLVHGPVRSDSERQRPKLRERTGITSPILAQAVELMETRIEQPIAQEDLAQTIGVSGRQVERLFRKYLGQTPRSFYNSIRLEQARSLLRSTDLTVQQIAYATGYCSSSYFSKRYRDKFGMLPNKERHDRQSFLVQSPGEE